MCGREVREGRGSYLYRLSCGDRDDSGMCGHQTPSWTQVQTCMCRSEVRRYVAESAIPASGGEIGLQNIFKHVT